MKIQWMLPLVLATAMPMTSVAEEKEADPKSPPPATTTETPSSKVQALADKYKVPPADVQGLRDKKMGWGEIDKALAISQKSGKPLPEVMKLRESGMGWGQIAQKYGFKLGDVAGKGDKGERGEKGDRGEKGKDREERAKDRGASGHGDHGASDKGHGGGKGHR